MKEFLLKLLMEYRYVVALVIFALTIGFIGEHCIVNRIAQKQTIAELNNKIDEQVKKFNKDKEKLNKLRNDPETVKQVAHEMYYMKTADEDVFVIEDED